MVLEESTIIHAPLSKIWKTFTDISCWNDWNTVFRNVSADRTEIMTEGNTVRLRMSLFYFPISIEPVIEEIIPQEKVVWSSEKYGISALHTFIF